MKCRHFYNTITDFPDMLSFFIGMNTQLEAVNIFCLYCGVGIIFTYLYTLSHFIAFFAFAADAEYANQHALVPFVKVISPEKRGAHFLCPLFVFDVILVSRWKRYTQVGTTFDALTAIPSDTMKETVEEIDSVQRKESQGSETSLTLTSKFFRNIYGSNILHPSSKASCFLRDNVVKAINSATSRK